jgi:hypothetical protein
MDYCKKKKIAIIVYISVYKLFIFMEFHFNFFQAHVCMKCGSILSPHLKRITMGSVDDSSDKSRRWICRVCKQYDSVKIVTIPFVFRYLVAELAAMNIRVKLDVAPISSH